MLDELLIAAVAWVIFGYFVAYPYARNMYRWDKNRSIVFALGGLVTGVWALMDLGTTHSNHDDSRKE